MEMVFMVLLCAPGIFLMCSIVVGTSMVFYYFLGDK
jgi:hypothetical protein